MKLLVQLQHDLAIIRDALYSGQISSAKVDGQRALERLKSALALTDDVLTLNDWVRARPSRGYMVSDTGVVLYGTPNDAKHHGANPEEAICSAARSLSAGKP